MIYYILFGGLLITSFLDFAGCKKESQKLILYIWAVIYVLIKGLRWDTGTDFPQFYACFQYSSWSNIFSYWRYGEDSELMEPGYVFINVLFKTLIPSYTAFLLITNAFIMYSYVNLLLKCIQKYRLVAFAMMMITVEMYPVRQTIATAILCYSYLYAYNRDMKKFLITIFLAFTIHKSSLMMLPIWWLPTIGFNLWLYIGIYLFMVIGRQILMNYLMGLFDTKVLLLISGSSSSRYYISDEELAEFNMFTIFNSLFQLGLFSFVLFKIKSKDSNYNLYEYSIKLYFFQLVLNVLGSLPGLGMVAFRISNNLLVFYPITISFVVDFFCKRRLYLLSISLFVMFWVIKYNRNPCVDENNIYYKECYSPYYSIFDSDDGKLIRTSPWPYNNN